MRQSLSVSVIVPARHAGFFLAESISRLVTFLTERYGRDAFEIVIVPNKRTEEKWDDTLSVTEALAVQYADCVRCVPLSSALGKGNAIRYGFLVARGEWIFLTDADLPYDLSFFDQASAELLAGADFVAGNRRLQESRFDTPVSLLHLIYRRHRLGVNFNRLVRFFLGVESLDTQCGIKAMTFPFARKVFLGQMCPGFLADIEYFLIQSENGCTLKQLPVRLTLRDEKSTVRLFREAIAIAWWLPKLCVRKWRGGYRYPAVSAVAPTRMTADDWGMSPGVNAGILELARLGIVRRVSMMARAPFLACQLDELLKIPGVECGLHFDLTSEWTPLRLSFFKRKPVRETVEEFLSQVGILKSNGVAVQYVDGHHHVQVFPGMAAILVPLLLKCGITSVRVPVDPTDWTLRGLVLRCLGYFAGKVYARAGIHSQPFFYPRPVHYQEGFKLLADVGRHSNSEIPVHPAAYDDFDDLKYRDSYRGRVWELGVLRALFRDACSQL